MKTFIVVIVAAIVVFFVFGWMALPQMLSKKLSEKAGVPVSVSSVILGPAEIGVKRIVISNVPGDRLPTAFSASSIAVDAPLTHYFKEIVEIEELTIDDVYLGLEFDSIKGTKGNWTTIMEHMSSPTAPSEEKNDKVVIIKRLILTNINVDVVYKDQNNKLIKLKTIDRMELTDIRSDKGLPTEQIMKSVLGQTLKSIFVKENLNNMIDQFLQSPSGTLQNMLSPLQKLF